VEHGTYRAIKYIVGKGVWEIPSTRSYRDMYHVFRITKLHKKHTLQVFYRETSFQGRGEGIFKWCFVIVLWREECVCTCSYIFRFMCCMWASMCVLVYVCMNVFLWFVIATTRLYWREQFLLFTSHSFVVIRDVYEVMFDYPRICFRRSS
jgi:hypothetical protein